MLRKLVINDWVHVYSGVILEDRRRMVIWHVPVWGDFCWNVGSKCGKMGWPLHRKKNFFINDSVGLSKCDCSIETVKYTWVNIWCMLDWILSQKCRNTLPLHTAVEQLGVPSKTLDAVVPDQLLATNTDVIAYQMEEY